MIDELEFRKSWSFFPTGVSVLAVKNKDNNFHGMTASSIMSISLTPPIIMVSVGLERTILDHLESADFFSVSLLTKKQENVALSFSKSNNQNRSFFSSNEDVFFIDDCLGYFFCVKHKSLRVGDHMVYFLEVENMEFYTKDPLVWYKGNFENIL